MAKRDRKKEVKMRKLLLLIWFVFIIAFASFAIFLYKKKDTVKEDLNFTTKFSYQTNADPDINALVINYLAALSRSDQATLQSCVTNPAQFDNMATVQSQARVITGYGNINCYTVQGLDENSVVCFAVANISIVNIDSKPLDMLGPYYIVKTNGQYLIDNSMLSQEVQDYMTKVCQDSDIQELYRIVKEDEEKCATEDPGFKEFLDKLNN
ncbi:MAG: hypothetical protein K6E10_02120 [Eubacterium sp.]|nr:hypothetical protein [Eubacterium sp.]